MMLNVGEISFINYIPLNRRAEFFPYGRKTFSLPPSQLNELCRRQILDVSPVSFFAYKDIEKNYARLENFCIAANSEVKSVELFSNFGIEELEGKRVFAARESENSVGALRAICRFRGNFDVFKNRAFDIESADAALIIGDRALAFDSRFKYKFDIGSLWRGAFGCPLVCSCIAIRREIFDSVKEKIAEYYDASLEEFQKNRKKYCLEAAEKIGKNGFDSAAADAYYSGLAYKIDKAQFDKTRDILNGKFA
ncbi:MAG: hypothetical protein J6T16_05200 [Opitutales bacterium]|nr:hypothetical protein [Opitutales bacterium]